MMIVPLHAQTLASPAVNDILTFWLDSSRYSFTELNQRWFQGGSRIDRVIGERFGSLIERALAGGLRDWESETYSLLALIVLLDQFPRHVFRGSARAYAGDPRARRLCRTAQQDGLFRSLPWHYQVFALMPLEHSESELDQSHMVAALEQLLVEADADSAGHLGRFLRAAKEHRSIIRQFGRFPHRNAVLGRESTPAELAFLVDGPRFGQGGM